MKKKYVWTSESLELRGKYLWRDELIPMLYRHLGVKPGIKAIDIGCGSGFFTRLIAKGLQGQGKVIGVDNDERLLNSARELTAKESLDSLVEFKKASAYSLPFLDNSTDIVACHTLLYVLGRPLKCLHEMVRVVKPRGRVVAVEADYRGCVIQSPSDERYDALTYRFNSALIKSFKEIYGADLCIGSKLPSLFMKAQLKQIEAYGYLLPTSPPTWENKYSVEELADYYMKSLPALTSWSKEEKKAMENYGISEEQFEEYLHETVRRIKGMITNPQRARTNTFISMRSFFVVVGKKIT